MKPKEFEVGSFYRCADGSVVRIVSSTGAPSAHDNELCLQHIAGEVGQFLPITPEPSEAEYVSKERVYTGADTLTCTTLDFAKVSRLRLPNPVTEGETLARRFLGVAAQKNFVDTAFERAARFDSVSETRLFGGVGPKWCFTFADGSRLAFGAPFVFAEIDLLGAPILDSPHQLDYSLTYTVQNQVSLMKKINKWYGYPAYAV